MPSRAETSNHPIPFEEAKSITDQQLIEYQRRNSANPEQIDEFTPQIAGTIKQAVRGSVYGMSEKVRQKLPQRLIIWAHKEETQIPELPTHRSSYSIYEYDTKDHRLYMAKRQFRHIEQDYDTIDFDTPPSWIHEVSDMEWVVQGTRIVRALEAASAKISRGERIEPKIERHRSPRRPTLR